MRSLVMIAVMAVASGISPATQTQVTAADHCGCQSASTCNCSTKHKSRRAGGWQLRGGWLYLDRDAGDGGIFNIGNRQAADDDGDIDLLDNDDNDPLDNDNDDLDDGGFNAALIGNRLLDLDDLNADWQSGFEVSLLRLPVRRAMGGCCDSMACDSGCCDSACDSMGGCPIGGGCFSDYGVELRYFQLTDWNSTSSFAIDDDDVILGATPIQIGRDATANVRYDSDLYNAEFNLLRATRIPQVILLGGFRYLHLDESFGAQFDATAPVDTARFGFDTENDLYGGQIGAMVNLFRGRFTVDGFGKAGIYAVNSDGDFGVDSDVDFLGRDDEDDLGFVGELGLTGGYQLTDCFGIESGYRLLWIDGVALASEQLSGADLTSGAYNLNRDGELFYHGTTVQGVWTY